MPLFFFNLRISTFNNVDGDLTWLEKNYTKVATKNTIKRIDEREWWNPYCPCCTSMSCEIVVQIPKSQMPCQCMLIIIIVVWQNFFLPGKLHASKISTYNMGLDSSISSGGDCSSCMLLNRPSMIMLLVLLQLPVKRQLVYLRPFTKSTSGMVSKMDFNCSILFTMACRSSLRAISERVTILVLTSLRMVDMFFFSHWYTVM